MGDHVYKKIEVVGSSSSSIEDAIQSAVKKTSQTVKRTEWFEVDQIRGHVVDGEVGHYQVVMKIGFRLDD